MAIYAFLCFFEWGHWSLGILTEVGDTAENFGASVQLVKILIFQGTFLDSVFRRIHWIHDEWFFFSWWQVVLYCGGSWMIFSASEFLSKTPQKIQQEVFKFNLALQTWNKHLTAYITFVRFLYHCLACSFYLGMRSSIWMASVFYFFLGSSEVFCSWNCWCPVSPVAASWLVAWAQALHICPRLAEIQILAGKTSYGKGKGATPNLRDNEDV